MAAIAVTRLPMLLLLLTCLAAAADPNESKAARVLDETLAQKNPDDRADAVAAYGLIGLRGGALARLSTFLKDPDYKVRLSAIAVLSDFNDRRTIPVLRTALEDSVPEVAFSAARVLFRLKDPHGREFLLDVVSKEEKAKSGLISSTLRDTTRQWKTAKSALLFTVRSGSGFIPLPGVGMGFAAAQSLFADADFSARANSILLLSTERSAEIDSLIANGLQDGDWSVRAASAQALALRDRPASRGALAVLFDDKKEKVRVRAAAGYLRLTLVAAESRTRKPAATTARPGR